jgi:hypothetical protein
MKTRIHQSVHVIPMTTNSGIVMCIHKDFGHVRAFFAYATLHVYGAIQI